MPAAKALPSPVSTGTGKQSALSAGTEQAASESSGHSGDPAATHFQQAFSSALHDSTAATREGGKLVSSAAQKPAPNAQLQSSDAQLSKTTDTQTKPGAAAVAGVPVAGNQISMAVNSLLADSFFSTSIPASLGDSKSPALSAPTQKEQSATKSKGTPQTEPVDPQAPQSPVDNQAAALIGSLVTTFAIPAAQPQAPLPTQVPSDTAQASTPPVSSVRDSSMPAAPNVQVQTPDMRTTAPVSTAPAQTAPNASAGNGQSAPDSLSFALLLHPKLAQGSTTSNQPASVAKATPDSKTAVVPVPSDKPSGGVLQPGETTQKPLPAADATQARGAIQPAAAASTQQGSDSSTAMLQSHNSQDSPSSTPARGKSQPASDTNSPAPAGSDLAKSVTVTNTAAVPNPAGAPVKAAQPSQVPATVQVLNAQNQLQNQAQAPAAKEVVVRLEGQSGEAISVRLVDQGGQVQVAVRSSDPTTANLLRQDLSSLTNNLDRAGWKPEILGSTPVASFVREASQGSGHDGQNPQGQGHAALDWSQQDSSRKKSVADLWDEILTRQGT